MSEGVNATRDETITEIVAMIRRQANLWRDAGISRDAAGDYVNGGRFEAKGIGAATVATQVEQLLNPPKAAKSKSKDIMNE